MDLDKIIEKIPRHWIKYGHIYYDQYIRDYIYVCLVCLQNETIFSKIYITKNVDSLLQHVQLKHTKCSPSGNSPRCSNKLVYANDAKNPSNFDLSGRRDDVKYEIRPLESTAKAVECLLDIKNINRPQYEYPVTMFEVKTNQSNNNCIDNGPNYDSTNQGLVEACNPIEIADNNSTNVIITKPLQFNANQNNLENSQVHTSHSVEANASLCVKTIIPINSEAFQDTSIANSTSNKSNDIATIEDNGVLECNYCAKEFTNVVALDRHHREHLKNYRPQRKLQIRPYQCNACGKRTITMDSMKLHEQRFHSITPDAETTICIICQKLILKVNFNQHLLVHTNIRLQCNYCKRTYKQKQSLRIHMKKYHPDCIGYSNDYSCHISCIYLKNHTIATNNNHTNITNVNDVQLLLSNVAALFPKTLLPLHGDGQSE